jgi:hypothetical protein
MIKIAAAKFMYEMIGTFIILSSMFPPDTISVRLSGSYPQWRLTLKATHFSSASLPAGKSYPLKTDLLSAADV